MEIGDAWLAALAGLMGGLVLGLAARLGRFCALGAIEDALYGGSFLRLRMWGLAGAVAMFAVFVAEGAGIVETGRSIYLRLPWSPLATALGGLMFGYGMALVGTCAYGALARLGGGDLRALVMVLVIGLSAYMAVGGLTALARARLTDATAVEPFGIAHGLGATAGLPAWPVGIVLALGLAAIALADGRFRRARGRLFAAAAAGGAVAFGWIATARLGATAFVPVPFESYSFVTPLGDSILYAMTSTGATVDFGIGAVVGVVLGAALGSAIRGEFRWEACDDARELRRQILGAFLMGTGGVLALGCTVGQGLSGLSVLAPSAVVAVICIGLGAIFGLRLLVEGRLFA